MQPKLFIIDDEANILKTLQRQLADEPYEVVAHTDPIVALKILQENEFAVVVSDRRMPAMDGITLLERVREVKPDTVRIVLTGYADYEVAMAAINNGHVYRFINKPWDERELKLAIRDALEHYRLSMENRRLLALTQQQNRELKELNRSLEAKVNARTRDLRRLLKAVQRSFRQSIRVFSGVLELFSPDLLGHGQRVAALACDIARCLDVDSQEIEIIEAAALLHDIGLIGLPEALLKKNPALMKPEELALVQQHPTMGYAVLHRIDGLKAAAELVAAHHEHHDGSGYPRGIGGRRIPLGARIVGAANAFDNFRSRKETADEAAMAAHLKNERGRVYDPEVAACLQGMIAELGGTPQGCRGLTLQELVPGMVLAQPVHTGKGRLLLPRDYTLDHVMIERLRRFHGIDPIVSKIYVVDRNRPKGEGTS